MHYFMKNMGKKLWSIIEKISYGLLTIIFKIIHKDLTVEVFNGFMQFVKFGIVGVSNTVISYFLYAISLLTFQKLNILGKVDYLVAQVNKMVFTAKEGEQRSLWKTLLKTYVSYSFTGLFLNSILLVVWVRMLGVSEFIAPIFNLLISVPLNFIINKFWAFKSDAA